MDAGYHAGTEETMKLLTDEQIKKVMTGRPVPKTPAMRAAAYSAVALVQLTQSRGDLQRLIPAVNALLALARNELALCVANGWNLQAGSVRATLEEGEAALKELTE